MCRVTLRTFLAIASSAAVWGCSICSDQTVVSDGFSEESFRRVRIGATREEVVQLLGRPLNEDCKNALEEYWQYGTKDQIWDSAAPRGVVRVIFDENGSVVQKIGDKELIAKIGSDKKAVLGSLGEPVIKMPKRVCSMSFTAPAQPGNNCVRTRQITFDREGRVAEVIAYSMRD